MLVLTKKKILLLFTLLQFVTCVLGQSSSNLLETKITLNEKNKTIPELLEMIEQLGNFSFTYNSDIISQNKRISISVRQKTVAVVLQQILGDRCSFTAIGGKIVIGLATTNAESKPNEKQKSKTIVLSVDSVKTTIFDTVIVQISDTQRVVIRDTLRICDTIRSLVKSPSSQWQVGGLYQESFVSHELQKNKVPASIGAQQYAYGMLYKQLSVGSLGIGVGLQQVFASVAYSVQRSFIDSSSSNTQTAKYYRYREVFSYFMFKNGDTILIPVLDSSISTVTARSYTQAKTIETYSGINRYRFLTIPISYSFPVFKKAPHSLEISCLLVPSLLVSSQGSIVRNNEEVFALTTSFPGFAISAQTALAYCFAINNRTHLCLEYWAGIQTSNVYFKPVNNVCSTFWSGLSLGIKTFIGND